MYSSAKETYNFIGNDNIEQFMLNSINSRKLHHAYLFSGTKGIGKATFAYRAARYILSNALKENMDIDKSKKVSKLIEKNSHPDFMVLEKDLDKDKSIIEIDKVRKCINFFNHTPTLGAYKICIIDSLDEMNINSANALLKIIEEPQKNSLFFIISHSKETVLPTIRSRCLNLRFNKFSDCEIKKFLNNKILDEKVYDLNEVISLSHGSVGRAFDLINEDSQEIIVKVKSLFNHFSDENFQKLENALIRSNKIDLFFELSLLIIDKTIKELILDENYQENKRFDELFLLRTEIQRIYHEGKKYKNINNHMILQLILLIKKSFYH